MFSSLTIEVSDRISAVRRLLETIRDVESAEAARGVDTLCSKILKGLLFVQLYAIYEYAVSQAFSRSVEAFNGSRVAHAALRDELMGLALDAEFTSVGAVGAAKTWTCRTALVCRARSSDPAVLRSDRFPSDGSHYRHQQLVTLWAIFGITDPTVPTGRLIGRIDEVVEHRNALAHGRATPEAIGCRYTLNDLRDRINDFEEICLHLVATMSVHCADDKNFM